MKQNLLYKYTIALIGGALLLTGCQGKDVNNDRSYDPEIVHNENYIVRNPEIANYIREHKQELEEQEQFIQNIQRKRLSYSVSGSIYPAFMEFEGKLYCSELQPKTDRSFNLGNDADFGDREKAFVKNLLQQETNNEMTTISYPKILSTRDREKLLPLYYCLTAQKISKDYRTANERLALHYNSVFYDRMKDYEPNIAIHQGTSRYVKMGAEFRVFATNDVRCPYCWESKEKEAMAPIIHMNSNIYTLYLINMPSTWKTLQDIDKFLYNPQEQKRFKEDLERKKEKLRMDPMQEFSKLKREFPAENVWISEEVEELTEKQKEYKYTLNYILSHKPFDYSSLPREKILVDFILAHEMTHQNFNLSDVEMPEREMLTYTKFDDGDIYAPNAGTTYPYHEWHADMTAFSYLKTIYPEWEVRQLYNLVRNARIGNVATTNWRHRTGSFFDKVPFNQIHDFNRCGSILSPYSNRCLDY